MPEASQFNYSVREVLELLIKKQGLHEGIWALRFTFALIGSDVPYPPSGNKEMVPAAILMVPKFLLQKLDKPRPNSVDAAEVNPAKTNLVKANPVKK